MSLLIHNQNPQNIMQKDLLALSKNQSILSQNPLTPNPYLILNKSSTIISNTTGEPVIKNGTAENLAFKKIDENTYQPKFEGQILISSDNNLLIAVKDDQQP